MKRRSPEESIALFQEQDEGNLSIKEFCIQKNISKTYFYGLKKKYNEGLSNKIDKRFVKVERSPTNLSGIESITIQYQQTQIKLSLLIEPSWVAKLVKALA